MLRSRVAAPCCISSGEKGVHVYLQALRILGGTYDIQVGLARVIVRMNSALQTNFSGAALPGFRNPRSDIVQVQHVRFSPRRLGGSRPFENAQNAHRYRQMLV